MKVQFKSVCSASRFSSIARLFLKAVLFSKMQDSILKLSRLKMAPPACVDKRKGVAVAKG